MLDLSNAILKDRWPNRWLRPSISLGAGVIIAGALILSLLQHFVLTLPKPPATAPQADGIVVTTGGQARLRTGLDLLANKKAPHLLITGVGDGINKQMISRSLDLTARGDALLACCVSLEFMAKDTIGNAVAAKKWAAEKDIQTILLVTSDYHMPRAVRELAHQMPRRTIIAYPVKAPDLAGKSWYSDWQTYRLYMREFLKYHLRTLVIIIT